MSGEILLDPFKDCPTFEVLITEGDQNPEWAFTFHDTDIDANPVELVIERPTGSTTLVIAATVLDGVNGVGKFSFTSTSFVSGPAQLVTLFAENTATSKRETLFRFFIDVTVDPHP